ncbi:hypothetical protein BT96DRAFT_470942 [Gymnopus androsaceus JB14]|uniref:Uncharacterized protein n=1 Tax=Gymnopus androsaceus JB14 TaxID=1447944 RepID=A0A6A4IKS8_9AGAR|nr:hypothetical protein BT96DRAFT_470942 [Gymnopus androsaceus JB14]
MAVSAIVRRSADYPLLVTVEGLYHRPFGSILNHRPPFRRGCSISFFLPNVRCSLLLYFLFSNHCLCRSYIMSIRTVQTDFTTASAMIATPNILTSLDLNVAYPPGLVPAVSPSEKALAGRTRHYSGSSSFSGRNLYSNSGLNWNNPRSSNRSANKRYPQGMRLPSSSYQVQNQYRRSSSAPLYQRTSRFDPFGDSKETPLSPSPVITSEPLYTHYYYYDPSTNRPTLAYADDKNPVNAANLTTSTNILLDTLLNGRLDTPRSPSPPTRVISPPQPVVETPSQPKSRSPSPPHSPRPRAAAISRPNPPVTKSPPVPVSSAPVSPPPPPPIKVSKAQRDAIARVVANMLLNRADGLSRRVRKCNSSGYVKSGLSRVVTVE